MGKRGPQKKPKKALELTGSWRAKTRGEEPVAEGAPAPPPELSPEARRLWTDVLEQLEAMGLVGECDSHALGRYCQAVVNYWKAQAVIADKGLTFTTTTTAGGEVVKERPEVKIANKLSEECRKLENLFGLNPSARAGLVLHDKKPQTGETRGKKPKSRFFAKTG